MMYIGRSAGEHQGQKGDHEMRIELTQEERELLQNVLESYRGRLRAEIFRTDSRAFKASLKDELETLERLIEKTSEAVAV
jgi:hypothetical protein